MDGSFRPASARVTGRAAGSRHACTGYLLGLQPIAARIAARMFGGRRTPSDRSDCAAAGAERLLLRGFPVPQGLRHRSHAAAPCMRQRVSLDACAAVVQCRVLVRHGRDRHGREGAAPHWCCRVALRLGCTCTVLISKALHQMCRGVNRNCV